MRRSETAAKAFVFVLAVGLLPGLCLLYGRACHDDSTCGFTHCVKVK